MCLVAGKGHAAALKFLSRLDNGCACLLIVNAKCAKHRLSPMVAWPLQLVCDLGGKGSWRKANKKETPLHGINSLHGMNLRDDL